MLAALELELGSDRPNASIAARMSAGSGARTLVGLRVDGCSKRSQSACNAWREMIGSTCEQFVA
eukprot:6205302-Pleurochrysis_carterae.AAC.2